MSKRGSVDRGAEFAEQQLQGLLDDWPERLGICAQQTCQICGQTVRFTGWAATHIVFEHRECVRGWQPRDGRVDPHRHDHCEQERAALHRRETRYCELCRLLVLADEMASDGHWRHCANCDALMRELAPDHEPHEIVRALVRWRWERSWDA